MLMPKKEKYRKQHKGRNRGVAKGGTDISFGEFGLQALESGWLSSKQIEAARIAVTRHIKPMLVNIIASVARSPTSRAIGNALSKSANASVRRPRSL